ncbi:Competence protein ComM [Segatella copri]|nr:Competence protein ComM [Segatella copri]
MMVGELSLDGTLQPIKGALPIAIRARAEHFKGLIVPEQNAREAAVVNNLEVYGMKTLFEVIQFMSDRSNPSPTIVDTRKEFYEKRYLRVWKQHRFTPLQANWARMYHSFPNARSGLLTIPFLKWLW